MTRRVLVWDTAAVAADLVDALSDLVTVEVVAGRPVDQITDHVDVSPAHVVHVVAPDDGSDLPIQSGRRSIPAAEPIFRGRDIPQAVVLDGCYQPDLAERISRTGPGVIGLPGRLGRGQATEFARAWYARLGELPLQEAFDKAMGDTRFHRLPDAVQPQLHHVGAPEPVVFRGHDGAQPREVTIWYGTNRRPQSDLGYLYGSEPDDDLHLGSCVVQVPVSVPVGRTRARRTRGSVGPRQYVVARNQLMDADIYVSRLRAALSEQDIGNRSILLYIHGYRTHFTEAATRAAQLHSDLNNPGQMAFFSWPSCGTASGYFADEDNCQHAERYLLQFLGLLYRNTGAEKVNVIAHSMGNRPLLRVAMRIAASAPDARDLRFGHVFLAAADVSRRFFQAEAAAYPVVCEGITCYVSARDRALKSSGIVHTSDRAGLTPPLTLVERIDTIDASDVDLTFLGHGYYAGARPVLTDIHAILHGQHQPEIRFGIEQHMEPGGRSYWCFRP